MTNDQREHSSFSPNKEIIKNLQPVSEQYVIWQWALGEARSSKWERRNVALSPALREKLKTVPADSAEEQFDLEDQQTIVDAFLSDPARAPVAKIRALRCSWYKGVMPVKDIEDCYMVMWPLSEQLAPSGRLVEYTKAFKENRFPPGTEFDRDNTQRLYQSFDISQMIGAPILLSQTTNPPYCAIDGITRLCVINLRTQEGTLVIPEVPVILGISPNIFEWGQIPRQMQRV